MHVGAADELCSFEDAHGPLVPNFGVRVIAPHLNANLLALVHAKGCLDWEVHGEPTVHARCVLGRIDTVENVLVELCCEVACETVKLSLVILDDESLAVVAAKTLLAALRE